jgi:hypothetical protein
MGLIVVACASSAWATDGDWEVVVPGPPLMVKNRSIPNTAIKEIWAEGEIAAPVQDIQEACMRVERFRNFMPFLKDSREISEHLDDGSVYIYTMIDLPVVGKRDYVVRTWLRESVSADGSGTFRNEWKAFPDRLPRRSGISRIERNEGGWTVTPIGDGSKSLGVYHFAVDPGGLVPNFAANLGNQKGVGDTYKAVEKEAQRLRDARLAKSAAAAASATDGGLAGVPVARPAR